MPQSALRRTGRERLTRGWLFPAPHKVWAGKGTGHVCVVCGTTIAPSEIGHEVVEPARVRAHVPCYAIWREESDALTQGPRQATKKRIPLHIERSDSDGADPATAQYIVTFGGSKDEVGTVLLAKRQGLSGLHAFLRSLDIPSSEVETAGRVLAEQPRHEIRDVTLTQATLRRLGV